MRGNRSLRLPQNRLRRGAEFDIIHNTDRRTLERIGHVCLEYHDNATQWTHADLESFFAERGFQVRTTASRLHWYLGLLHAERV